MRTNNIIPLATFVASYVSFCAISSENIPQGFQDFYENKVVEVSFYFEGRVSRVVSNLSVEKLSVNNKLELDKIASLLASENVEADYVDIALNKLKKGIEVTKRCEGKTYEDCSIISKDVDVVFDYDNRKAKFFVSAKGFERTNKKDEYNDGILKNNAIINSLDLYSDYSSEGRSSVNLYGDTKLGVTNGHIKLSYELGDYNALNAASYIFERPGYYVGVGYFEDNVGFGGVSNSFNTNRGVGKKVSAGFSSSNNLKLNKNNSDKKLVYYSPVNGSLKVYRDDRLISLVAVDVGYGEISYTDLPLGIYDVRLEFSEYGNVTESYTELVNNLTGGRDAGQSDYSFFISSHEINNNESIDNIIDNIPNYRELEGSVNYIEGSVSHAFTDNLSIDQYLVLSDSNEQAFGVGISYVTPFGADITANVKLFNNKDLYSTLFFNYGDLTLSYYNYNTENPYDSSEEQLMLSNYFHGIIDEETLSVSYFKTLTDNLNLRSTALYTKYINETSYSADVELGYMFTNLWDISVGVGYVGSDSEYYSSNGEIRTTFSLSIPLSSNIYASSYVSYQGDTIETTESFEYNGKYIDRLGYRLRTQDSDIASEGYLSHSHKNEYVDGTVNASVNENESFGSFLIKNSQVITNGKIYFTSEESDSYIVVEPEINNTSKEIKDQKTVVGYSIIGNESNEERVEQETTGKLIAVSEYEEYDYDFLLNNNDYILDESSSISVSYFSIPGSVHIVNPYLIKSDQDIIKLVNINGDYVENASCEGESCISSTELTPGVYQVNSTRESIILASNDSVCLVDPKESIKVDLGYCFPNVEPLEKFELDGKEYVFISAAFGEKGTKHQLEYLDEEVRGEVKVQELNEKLNLLYIEVSDRTMKYFSSRTEYINKQELKSISSIYKLATRDSEKYANK